MHHSRHSLHHLVALTDEQKIEMSRALASRVRRHELLAGRERVPPAPAGPLAAPAAPLPSYAFPITTVSMNYNFDAYIGIGFLGADPANAPQLLVDSGNSNLIVPRWEDIAAIPNYQASYQVLGQASEPWGCPANVVRGPIQLFDSDGATFTIPDCVFYACTGDSPQDQSRTANFGTGCIAPWSASPSNAPSGLGVTLQPVLSQTAYPYVESDYAPMEKMQLASTAAAASTESAIRIYNAAPDGYRMFDIIRDLEWMALTPKSLSIANTPTQWPGNVASPIAMIDTGGGPVYLSDPNGYLYRSAWPSPVANPDWASSSTSCESTQALLEITIGDAAASYTYVIDNSTFPQSARGLTLVMCEMNAYMMGQQGMNIGGISALVNSILIDFGNNQVGFKKR
jgi:hypothetical protein